MVGELAKRTILIQNLLLMQKKVIP